MFYLLYLDLFIFISVSYTYKVSEIMLYKSIHNPTAEASGELIVLSYKDQNILIPLFQDYKVSITDFGFTPFGITKLITSNCLLT